MLFRKSSFLPFVFLFFLPESMCSQKETEKDWNAQRITWQGIIKHGTPIEIQNPYGDVRLRGTDQPQVDVIAHAQMKLSDKHTITFLSQMEHGVLKLIVSYAGREEDTIKKNGKRRLDMAVVVPHGSPLMVRTHKGSIQAKGIKNDVDFYSERGNISSSHHGHAVIGTRQGKISASLRGVNWDKPTELYSVLGSIEVYLPRQTSLAIEATTSGKITTDYSIQIQRNPGEKEKFATMTLGEGKNRLVIKNSSGAIEILEGSWRVD